MIGHSAFTVSVLVWRAELPCWIDPRGSNYSSGSRSMPQAEYGCFARDDFKTQECDFSWERPKRRGRRREGAKETRQLTR